MEILAFVFISVMLGALGQISMKQGMNVFKKLKKMRELATIENIIKIATDKFVVFGIGCYVASSIIWLGILSKLDVSYVYPLVSIGYIITTIFAIAFLKEKVTSKRWLGTIIIVIGSLLVISS